MSIEQQTKPVGEVRITDPYVISLVAAEQDRTKEKSSAKVAGRLIAERLAMRETASAESAQAISA
jgi:hypothetical protein